MGKLALLTHADRGRYLLRFAALHLKARVIMQSLRLPSSLAFSLALFLSLSLAAACGAAGPVLPAGDAGALARDGGRPDGGALADGGASPEDGGPDDGLIDAGPLTDDAGPLAPDGGPGGDGGFDGGSGCALPARDGGPINPGWIGGACAGDQDCTYDGGVCLTSADGFPGGSCSQRCTSTCPDRTGPDDTVTFCVPGSGRLAGGGMCVSRCDFAKEPLGCRSGYQCQPRARNATTTLVNACAVGASACYAQASQACVSYRASADPLDVPANCPNALCDLRDAMTVRNPIGGIVWRSLSSGNVSDLYMSCPLSLALERLAPILHDLNVVEVSHIGTYNCREIAGSNCSLSQHGLGLAIDLGAFKLADGTVINVLNDWEPAMSIAIEPSRTTPCRFDYTPTTDKGRFLYELAYRMCDAHVWSIILTPNYNAAHDNHFHVDLTAGYSRTYLGHEGPTVLRQNLHGE